MNCRLLGSPACALHTVPTARLLAAASVLTTALVPLCTGEPGYAVRVLLRPCWPLDAPGWRSRPDGHPQAFHVRPTRSYFGADAVTLDIDYTDKFPNWKQVTMLWTMQSPSSACQTTAAATRHFLASGTASHHF